MKLHIPKIVFLLVGMMMLMGAITMDTTVAEEYGQESDTIEHNWEQYSSETNVIEAGSHEFTYWKNFIQRTRTCNLSYEIKTVVYYCDIHDHTRSETFIEEEHHSEDHS
ncbi:hypothetical protein [Oceanobacillus halotolerans]|uniref:hypothetical protein n=1 Tax=Oceanobacillus halotolerans TaxID=2663380 RepID=UPI0013D8FC99|nr:hypothetical protein [Oceanobacillus halotolerans]